MSIAKKEKLKNLMIRWTPGLVATSAWLRELSISGQLVDRYLKSGWIEPLGRGAYKRMNDKVSWQGGLFSLQQQLHLDIHVGGISALAVRGMSHYLRLGGETIFLFAPLTVKAPVWFRENRWENPIHHTNSSFLPAGLAIKAYEDGGFLLRTSSPERAILECLYLSPKHFDLVECYQLIESMSTLRPQVMQELLEQCTSIRVKRLFLFMAKKASLPVLEFLDLGRIDLGSGDRSITQKGVYIAEFKISIPEELVNYV